MTEASTPTPAPGGPDEVARARAALDNALVEIVRLSEERDGLERRYRESARGLGSALAKKAELERAVQELQGRLSEERHLHAATVQAQEKEKRRELLLSQTTAGLHEFRERYENELRKYRGQRAWKIMLWFRWAYTLVMRRGWQGRLRFAKDFLGLRPGARGRLEAHELQFPRIENFVPGELLASTLEDETPPGQTAARPRSGSGRGRPETLRPLQGHDVIVLPVFEFDFRMQRPQHLAEQFTLSGHRVFWVSPSREPSSSATQQYELVELRQHLWEVHLRVSHANVYLGQLTDTLVAEHEACIRELYRDCGIGASAVVVQLPFWRRLALSLRESFGTKVIYDCMDDWGSMPDLGEFTRSEEELLAKECDTLVVSSRKLQASCRERGLEPLLARNAVDFKFFSDASAKGHLREIGRPVVGYFGAIADWFDYALLYDVARSRPKYSFVLVGGLGLEEEVRGEQIHKLRELDNVHLVGHKPYHQIPSYLAEFDACIIPFVLNQVTHATDPVKLYEYLSQGKPVVTTAMGEMAECRGLVYVAGNPEEFAEKLDLALQERDPDLKACRIAFASENTWRARMKSIESAVAASFPPVSVIIVTYNNAGYVRPCLDSLLRNTTYPRWEVLIVDNDSTDGTVDVVGEYVASDSRIRLIRQPVNAGFAAANNVGVRAARGEYLILLNMDTVVTPGWLERMMRHVRRDASVGMVVPVTNCAGNEAQVLTEYTNLQEMEAYALELARDNMGMVLDLRVGPLFCALIPRAAWEKVGELDERFEVGMFEDDDYSHRLARAGYRILTAEDCFVHHFGQGAFSKLAEERYQRVFEENRHRFEQKWGFSWIPHHYRPGVDGANRKFTPAEFDGP